MPTRSRSWTTTERNDMTTAQMLDPIPPGEILMEEFMRPLGISINALARDLAVPANRISGIINGTRAITADTALRLGKHFGVSPEIWLDLTVGLRAARSAADDLAGGRTLGEGPGGVRARPAVRATDRWAQARRVSAQLVSQRLNEPSSRVVGTKLRSSVVAPQAGRSLVRRALWWHCVWRRSKRRHSQCRPSSSPRLSSAPRGPVRPVDCRDAPPDMP